MITSVTSATVAATSAVLGWGVALGAGGAIIVIGLLLGIELADSGGSQRAMTVRRALQAVTVPLLIVFAVSVVAHAAAVVWSQT